MACNLFQGRRDGIKFNPTLRSSGSTTDFLGAGHPLRAFLNWPPGPVNRLGGPGLGVVRAEVDGSSPA